MKPERLLPTAVILFCAGLALMFSLLLQADYYAIHIHSAIVMFTIILAAGLMLFGGLSIVLYYIEITTPKKK